MRHVQHFGVSAVSFHFFLCTFTDFESTVHKEVSLSKNKPLPFKSVFSVHDFLIKLVSSNHSLIQKRKLWSMIHSLLNLAFWFLFIICFCTCFTWKSGTNFSTCFSLWTHISRWSKLSLRRVRLRYGRIVFYFFVYLLVDLASEVKTIL